MPAMSMLIDMEISPKQTIDTELGYHADDFSPGNYSMIFIINRISDPRSKNNLHEWMVNDFASMLFHSVTSLDSRT
jgi:hypothetical protein